MSENKILEATAPQSPVEQAREFLKPVVPGVSLPHTGYGDCGCFECWPPEPDFPLADHGGPLRDWHLWFVCFACWFGGGLLGVLIGVWAS